MTFNEKLYEFYKDHPLATNDEVANALEWTTRQVVRYKGRLKARGFIDVTADGVALMRPYNTKDDKDGTFEFKQETYREVIARLMACMDSEGLTTTQLIDISREIRTILKEVV